MLFYKGWTLFLIPADGARWKMKQSRYYNTNSPVTVWIHTCVSQWSKSMGHAALDVFNAQDSGMLNRLNLSFNQIWLVKPVISAQGWDECNQTCQWHLGDAGVILPGFISQLRLNNPAEDFPGICHFNHAFLFTRSQICLIKRDMINLTEKRRGNMLDLFLVILINEWSRSVSGIFGSKWGAD